MLWFLGFFRTTFRINLQVSSYIIQRHTFASIGTSVQTQENTLYDKLMNLTNELSHKWYIWGMWIWSDTSKLNILKNEGNQFVDGSEYRFMNYTYINKCMKLWIEYAI